MARVEPPAVLAADGDRGFNQVLRRHLEAFGCKVFCECDGVGALRVLRSTPVQLAILALDLPVMGGIEVVVAARESGRQFHVVFVDIVERPAFRRSCLGLGALAYTVKPLSEKSLSRVLQDALHQSLPSSERASRSDHDSLSELSPGLRVRLCIQAGPSTGSYSGTVVDKGPASLVISALALDGSPVYVSLGTSVLVGFPAARGWGEFESRVAGSYVGSSGIEILLSWPDHVLYRERRGRARLKATLPIRVWPAGSEDPASSMVSGQTEDIGRRGLRALFRGPLPLSVDGPVVLVISANHGVEEARLMGRAVWHEALGECDNLWHRYGFRFLRLAPKTRRRLSELLANIRSQGDDWETTGGQGFAEPGTAESSPAKAGD